MRLPACMCITLCWIGITASNAAAAGVPQVTTIITHGFSPDNKGAWVQGMAEAIIARAGEGSIYRYTSQTGGLSYVPADVADGSTNVIVLIFNWVPDSDGPDVGANWNYAQAAGDALYAMLRAPRYVSAVGEPPENLVTDRYIHFIGHSRGACVNSEAVRRLAAADIPVDHVTSHDPHPVNGTLDFPYNFNWGDPVPMVWSNVTFADNYWRADGGGLINGLDFDGIPITGAYNVQLSESALNCCAYSFAHSDVHLWYHGTIDLSPNPCDGEQCITSQMRQTWWPGKGGFAQQGYHFSQFGGGSALRPPITAAVSPGNVPVLYNGSFDNGSFAGWLHHGGAAAANQLLSDSGAWRLRLTPSLPTAQHNWMFLPAGGPAKLDFKARIPVAAAGNRLMCAMIDAQNVEHAIGEISLSVPSAGFVDHSLVVPGLIPREAVYRLQLRIETTAGPIAATVDVDDVAIILQPPIVGDLNGDGVVNVDDLVMLLGAWGPCEGCAADLNDDGLVNVDDLVTLLGAWG